jgi:hypothetical protein
MPNEPEIKSLSYAKRQRFFLLLVVVFLILLPTMIFYTTGYRISFDDTENRIVTTGGVYVTTDNLEVEVYLDDEQIRRPRLFRSAYYIQDIESGIHRVVVQQDGLNTWVKELPVDPYIVTEAAAFNMPLVTQLRPVSQYFDATGAAVLPSTASTSQLFVNSTSTIPIVFATSTATSTLIQNPEYSYATELFSTTSTSTLSFVDRFIAGAERFGFATTSTATSTVEYPQKGDISLLERENELYARYTGELNNIPYYFCLAGSASSTIAERYGEHVAEQVVDQRVSTTTPLYEDGNRICRSEIKIDRKRQDILYYDFLPGSSDLVLLQLEDGIYVSEIDDRAWQNTQVLYDSSDVTILVENEVIYIKQGELYAELLTEIPED